MVSSSASSRLSCGSSRAAAKAATTFLRWTAFWKIPYDIDAFNDRDSDADPWAVDAEMTAPGAQVSGRDNVIGFIAGFQEAFPDLRLEIQRLLSDGPAAAAEGIMTGTHNGVLHTTNGDVAPTGRTLGFRWAAVYVTDGDTLKAEHLFFDQMDLLGQLGLLPG